MSGDPRHTVAVLLASSVLVFVVSATIGRELLFAITGSPLITSADPEIADRWVDLMSVIVGGLLGYLIGSAPKEPPTPPDAG